MPMVSVTLFANKKEESRPRLTNTFNDQTLVESKRAQTFLSKRAGDCKVLLQK